MKSVALATAKIPVFVKQTRKAKPLRQSEWIRDPKVSVVELLRWQPELWSNLRRSGGLAVFKSQFKDEDAKSDVWRSENQRRHKDVAPFGLRDSQWIPNRRSLRA